MLDPVEQAPEFSHSFGVMAWRFAFPMLAALMGCATGRDAAPAGDLAGRTLRMTATNGQATILRFRGDGTVRATFSRRSLDGRWRVSERRLCFDWPQARRECWPYREPFERGRTRTITSDRGNVVRVTMR